MLRWVPQTEEIFEAPLEFEAELPEARAEAECGRALIETELLRRLRRAGARHAVIAH
jgi:hypothetical protein